MNLPILKNLASGKYDFLIKLSYRFFYLGLAGFLFFIIALNFNLFWLFGKMPSVDDLDNPKSEIASEIISTDMKVIGKFFFENGNRSPITFADIPDNFIDALIATEDVRFTRHSGIDARSMLRVFGGLITLNKKGGGSTISQQLAKNLFKLRQDESYEGLFYKIPVIRMRLQSCIRSICASKNVGFRQRAGERVRLVGSLIFDRKAVQFHGRAK
jgi:penicillin-binding protein 1A